MKKFFGILLDVPLFSGISEGELQSLLSCLGARVGSYAKGRAIFSAGDAAEKIGVICGGSVQIIREDVFGNRTIMARLSERDIFGEAFACAGVRLLPVSAVAAENCSVLLIDYRRIISACPSSCKFHSGLIKNMLSIIAEKNLLLNRKIEVLSARGTRSKLTAYLSAQAAQAGGGQFVIPFSRQELADYLCVDRSAMSAELGRMRDEGLLRFNRNSFELLGTRG